VSYLSDSDIEDFLTYIGGNPSPCRFLGCKETVYWIRPKSKAAPEMFTATLQRHIHEAAEKKPTINEIRRNPGGSQW
jgi:hypothetical protein